jgi:hypothetical protein
MPLPRASDAAITSARPSSSSCASTAAWTRAASSADGVSRIALASTSCSACASRVGGGQLRVRRLVGDDHCFGGAGQPVDADDAEDLAFGQRGEEAAWAVDLVDAGDGSAPNASAPIACAPPAT